MYKIITILIILFMINQLCLGWVSIVSFILMLNLMRQYPLNFYAGCIWGIVVYGVHTLWIVSSIGSRVDMKSALIVWLMLALWSGVLSGLWWTWYQRYPIISTIVYWYIMTRYCLVIIGQWEGYSLCNPALCVVDCAWLSPTVWYVHDIGIWFVCAVVARCVRYIPLRYIARVFITLIICDGVYSYKPYVQNHTMMPLSLPLQNYTCADQAGRAITDTIIKNLQKDLKPSCLVFPESTFCWDLNCYHTYIIEWCQSAGDVPIILCAHLCNGKVSYNACLLLHNKTVRQWYCKQHLMPMVERQVWLSGWLHTMGSCMHTVPYQRGDDIFEVGFQQYQIFICSELFHEIKPVVGLPVLFLWNDTWLTTWWIHRLALRFISYFELKYGVRVYHVATSGCTNIASM